MGKYYVFVWLIVNIIHHSCLFFLYNSKSYQCKRLYDNFLYYDDDHCTSNYINKKDLAYLKKTMKYDMSISLNFNLL